MEDKYIRLIIVPVSLRRRLFKHYHSGPSGGHMGTYKTLFRLRMRFFWPHMREDINLWVSKCVHCISYNVWKSQKSEIHFSWLITVLFWIMLVDVWSPGLTVDINVFKE